VEGIALCMVFSVLYALFCSLLYGMPASSAERQHPEAWPASIYGHLREGYLRKHSQVKELANFNLPSVAQDSSR